MENQGKLYTPEEEKAVTSFMSALYYNGFTEELKQLKDVFEKSNGKDSVFFPKQWKMDFTETQYGIFWSWLVIMFGDYGVSPRFGWVDGCNAAKLYQIMTDNESDFYDDNEED